MNNLLSLEHADLALTALKAAIVSDIDTLIHEDLAYLHYRFLNSGGSDLLLAKELRQMIHAGHPPSITALALADEWSVDISPSLDIFATNQFRDLLQLCYNGFAASDSFKQICTRFQLTKTDLIQTTSTELLLDWMTLWLLHKHPNIALFLFGNAKLRPFDSVKKIPLQALILYLPTFMLWQIRDCLGNNQKRRLLLELASGINVRLASSRPFPFNRRMAHYFSNSPNTLPYEAVITRAVVFGLGGDENLSQLLHEHFPGRFKQPKLFIIIVDFFKKTGHEVTPGEFKPLLGYLQHLWDENGSLSMKGRTLLSLQRTANEWYESLHQERVANYLSARNLAPSWKGASYKNFKLEKAQSHYEIIQLNSVKKLEEEGRQMMHCVGNYAVRCQVNGHSIWSLRETKVGRCRSLVTIEISKDHRIIQARKMFNATPDKYDREMIQQWAKAEGLQY